MRPTLILFDTSWHSNVYKSNYFSYLNLKVGVILLNYRLDYIHSFIHSFSMTRLSFMRVAGVGCSGRQTPSFPMTSYFVKIWKTVGLPLPVKSDSTELWQKLAMCCDEAFHVESIKMFPTVHWIKWSKTSQLKQHIINSLLSHKTSALQIDLPLYIHCPDSINYHMDLSCDSTNHSFCFTDTIPRNRTTYFINSCLI